MAKSRKKKTVAPKREWYEAVADQHKVEQIKNHSPRRCVCGYCHTSRLHGYKTDLTKFFDGNADTGTNYEIAA